MQDYASFCRQRAQACFHRRRRYQILSDEWRHEVADARRFIKAYRNELRVQDAELAEQVDDRHQPYRRYAPECQPTAEDELWAVILDLVAQSCGVKGGDEFDSWATSAYERAILALAGAGFVEIDPACGRIYAKLLPQARKFEEWMEFHDLLRRDAAELHGNHDDTPLTSDERERLKGIGAPITRGPTIPKDELTAEMIERPNWPKGSGI